MKLSIIIPTKNEERHLPALLKQLKKQTMQPAEVIVADAKSDDATAKLAKKLGAKVVKGGMPGVGRNVGAKHAKGDTLLFLDADVTLPSEDFIARAMRQFEERGLDMASTTLIPLQANLWDKIIHWVFNGYMRVIRRVKPHAAGCFMMVRKDVHHQLGGFDERITFCEDTDYAIRAAKIGHFAILKNVPIYVSTRRMRKEGAVMIAVKYLMAELHILFLGPIRHNAFNYTFDYKNVRYGRKK